MRRGLTATLLLFALGSAVAWAQPDVQQEMSRDVVLRALVDELERNMSGLTLEDLDVPYFIEYGLTDAAWAYVSAGLGAVTGRGENRNRSLRSDVRVGSYELDNSNFGGGGFGGYSGGMLGVAMPIEDDYEAIRQAVWWLSDRDYKGVVEQFAQKKAFMQTKLIEDKPDDFARAAPTVFFEERVGMAHDVPRLEQLAVALSEVFRAYPDVQSSGVNTSAYAGNDYLVNTEGTRMRLSGARFSVSINATVQADDGMKLSDSHTVHARTLEELPPREELMQRCQAMAERLIALKDAPILTTYAGPVLFDAQPAAALFARQFSGAFGGGQRPVGSRSGPDDFANKLNKRILPRFLNVVDDPAREVIAGIPVMGHYQYDDQAVPAKAVTLVEDGRLKGLLTSRNPSKEFAQSNGHGRGSWGVTRGSIGCLIVTAQEALDANSLKQELLDRCADEDLEFGIRIGSFGSGGEGGYSGYYSSFGGFRGGDYGGGIAPLVMYKIYPDGREELVRGAEIARVDFKAFKRMIAAGDTPYVLNSVAGGGGYTVVAPAMLFEELDLARIDRDFDKPPILPTPLARP